ncbi:Hypothetical Protein FCC1311_010912 [Hondaea fermentalgiana]|uniref:Uncharacterized protein n=1 Tax=Hondaea fermentalgiana TaxID=2315210 RepID=A0A2R5G8R3_9STRA|nr:Hypothetical Protein FCC1311_010912 [Hondaea fermentalgiana]|eukprot:GBG24873.1 Hypothetical Protein FCC1311_010912 [Hondaea fermentalgiana]
MSGATSKLLGMVAALGSGAGLAIQSAMNGALAVPLGSGLMASPVSFLVGVATLLLVAPFKLGQKPRDKGPNPKPLYWWHWCTGGSIGVCYICAGTFLGPKLGYGLFFCSVVAGQIITSLVLDHIAFLDLRRQPVTVWRVGSTVVVLVGAVLAIVDKVDVALGVGKLVGFVLLSFASGCLMAIQAPINSSLTIRFGTLPHRTALISFSVGTLYILVIWGISVGVKGRGLADVHVSESEPFMWFGGVLGVLYVVASVSLAPILGVGLFVVFVVFGQLFMSLFIDVFGLFASNSISATPLRIVGVVLVFVGAAGFRMLPLRLSSCPCAGQVSKAGEPTTSAEQKMHEQRAEVEDPSEDEADVAYASAPAGLARV